MFKLFLILVIVCPEVPSAEDVCLFKPESLKRPLQVAFVLDRSIEGVWTLFQNETIYQMMSEYAGQFVGTEFALTGHADWPFDDRPYSKKDLESCYIVAVQFTTDKTNVLKNVNSIKQLKNNFSEKQSGSYFALMNTAAEPTLGWKQDKEIRKVIVIFTSKYVTVDLKFEGNRKPPKGDGTDKCIESLPPDPRDNEMEAALIDREALVVNVKLNLEQDSTDWYKDDFGYIYVPYIQYTIPNDRQIATVDDVQRFNYKELSKLIVRDTVEELKMCTYSDPPGYNTFGL